MASIASMKFLYTARYTACGTTGGTEPTQRVSTAPNTRNTSVAVARRANRGRHRCNAVRLRSQKAGPARQTACLHVGMVSRQLHGGCHNLTPIVLVHQACRTQQLFQHVAGSGTSAALALIHGTASFWSQEKQPHPRLTAWC